MTAYAEHLAGCPFDCHTFMNSITSAIKHMHTIYGFQY